MKAVVYYLGGGSSYREIVFYHGVPTVNRYGRMIELGEKDGTYFQVEPIDYSVQGQEHISQEASQRLLSHEALPMTLAAHLGVATSTS